MGIDIGEYFGTDDPEEILDIIYEEYDGNNEYSEDEEIDEETLKWLEE